MSINTVRESFILGFTLLLLFFLFGHTYGQKEPGRNYESVNYCDLVTHADLYDGKSVAVRATYRYGFEWQELLCLPCRDVGKTWLEIDADKLPKATRKALRGFPKDGGAVNAEFKGLFQSSGGPFGD